MFWRYKQGVNGKDEFGRTYEEAWQEHAIWCFDTLKKNEPDDEKKFEYINKNSPSYVTRPVEFTKYLAGDAVFNAYAEIKMNFESFKKYYTAEQIEWVESWLKKPK